MYTVSRAAMMRDADQAGVRCADVDIGVMGVLREEDRCCTFEDGLFVGAKKMGFEEGELCLETRAFRVRHVHGAGWN